MTWRKAFPWLPSLFTCSFLGSVQRTPAPGCEQSGNCRKKQELLWAKEEPSPSSWVAPGIPSRLWLRTPASSMRSPFTPSSARPWCFSESGLGPESQRNKALDAYDDRSEEYEDEKVVEESRRGKKINVATLLDNQPRDKRNGRILNS